jgi:hypothetical protein
MIKNYFIKLTKNLLKLLRYFFFKINIRFEEGIFFMIKKKKNFYQFYKK